MQAPPDSPDEAERLASLRRLALLDTPAEDAFDRITRIAARLFDVPISLVALIDEKRQWFKSATGLATQETSRAVSFCGHSILSPDIFVVTNAAEDVRFADNPNVTGDPNIRFYAGCPLQAEDGHRIGTICVLDRKPRSFSSEDRQILADLGKVLETELRRKTEAVQRAHLLSALSDAERRASIDSLTRLWSRDAILRHLDREHALALREKRNVTVGLLDVDHFKSVNDRFGHAGGDQVLSEVAVRIRRAVRPYDVIGRYGGEEFLLIFTNCDQEQASRAAERIREEIFRTPIPTGEGESQVSISIGLCQRPAAGAQVSDIIRDADRALYAAKDAGRNCVIVA